MHSTAQHRGERTVRDRMYAYRRTTRQTPRRRPLHREDGRFRGLQAAAISTGTEPCISSLLACLSIVSLLSPKERRGHGHGLVVGTYPLRSRRRRGRPAGRRPGGVACATLGVASFWASLLPRPKKKRPAQSLGQGERGDEVFGLPVPVFIQGRFVIGSMHWALERQPRSTPLHCVCVCRPRPYNGYSVLSTVGWSARCVCCAVV